MHKKNDSRKLGLNSDTYDSFKYLLLPKYNKALEGIQPQVLYFAFSRAIKYIGLLQCHFPLSALYDKRFMLIRDTPIFKMD